MPIQFSSVSHIHNTHIKTLVYGGAGLGKTVLCATLGPGTFVISAERGLLSLRRQNLERLFGAGNPSICYDMPYANIFNAQDLRDVYAWAAQSHEAKKFHTIALDSLSEIAEVVLVNAKAAFKDPRQAYGFMGDTMEGSVRNFRELPYHVVMTAKMEPMKDELTGQVRFGPSMPGRRLGPGLPYFFDEVFRIGVASSPDGKAQWRYLQTQPDPQYEAKDRSGALAPLEPPHLSTVFSKILGG